MRQTISILATAALCAGVLGMEAGCSGDGIGGGGRATSVSVPLTLAGARPLNTSSFAGMLPETPVYIQVTDRRPAAKKDKIGQVTDKSTIIPAYPGSEPAEFVKTSLDEKFQSAGLNVVDNKSAAGRVITVELREFWDEVSGMNHRATVTALFTVTDKSGAKLWSGPMSGAGSTWGKGYNPGNYQKTLGNAQIQMIENLLNNFGFRKALGEAPGAGTDAAAPTSDTSTTTETGAGRNPLAK